MSNFDKILLLLVISKAKSKIKIFKLKMIKPQANRFNDLFSHI